MLRGRGSGFIIKTYFLDSILEETNQIALNYITEIKHFIFAVKSDVE